MSTGIGIGVDCPGSAIEDDDYEEVMVVATFQDIDESFVLKNSTTIAFSDIGTSYPTCIIDGRFKFKGNHEHSLGTQLILTSDENYSIVGQTDRAVVFKLESIEPKVVESNNSNTVYNTATTTTTTSASATSTNTINNNRSRSNPPQMTNTYKYEDEEEEAYMDL